jgi:hypothetical protein
MRAGRKRIRLRGAADVLLPAVLHLYRPKDLGPGRELVNR